MLPHLALQTWWSKTAADIETRAASEAEVVALEARYNVSLPHDFRAYLREGSPTVENWDAEDGNWWPVSRIKNIPDEYKHSVSDPIARNAAKHLFFLDYSIWCWAWAISCADDETRGKVALIGGTSDDYVANSFEEFVDRYTTDWDSISQIRRAAPFARFWRWLRGC
jgi:hypothetical protein